VHNNTYFPPRPRGTTPPWARGQAVNTHDPFAPALRPAVRWFAQVRSACAYAAPPKLRQGPRQGRGIGVTAGRPPCDDGRTVPPPPPPILLARRARTTALACYDSIHTRPRRGHVSAPDKNRQAGRQAGRRLPRQVYPPVESVWAQSGRYYSRFAATGVARRPCASGPRERAEAPRPSAHGGKLAWVQRGRRSSGCRCFQSARTHESAGRARALYHSKAL
jgi:hypothetical protein